MSVFEALSPQKPTPEQGAMRIRRTLAQVFQQIESSLELVRQVIDRHGRSAIDSALGKDQKEVVSLYRALKKMVDDNKPESNVPDLAAKS